MLQPWYLVPIAVTTNSRSLALLASWMGRLDTKILLIISPFKKKVSCCRLHLTPFKYHSTEWSHNLPEMVQKIDFQFLLNSGTVAIRRSQISHPFDRYRTMKSIWKRLKLRLQDHYYSAGYWGYWGGLDCSAMVQVVSNIRCVLWFSVSIHC